MSGLTVTHIDHVSVIITDTARARAFYNGGGPSVIVFAYHNSGAVPLYSWAFFGISILAGLQTIPVELHESATIDGAGAWGRFRHVTLPSLLPVIFIVTTFSIILTFFDFQLVYVLTGGGPANSTHLMATYAYSLSMGAGQMGLGSAVALSMVPVLGLLLVLLTLYVRKD